MILYMMLILKTRQAIDGVKNKRLIKDNYASSNLNLVRLIGKGLSVMK